MAAGSLIYSVVWTESIFTMPGMPGLLLAFVMANEFLPANQIPVVNVHAWPTEFGSLVP
jgi:ABC-type dipeptide/oligopeptide/nickel transport system permease component